MATRKIKDAKDLLTNELIYFKGHAQATFMSDGRTVEEAITSSTGSSGEDSDIFTMDLFGISEYPDDIMNTGVIEFDIDSELISMIDRAIQKNKLVVRVDYIDLYNLEIDAYNGARYLIIQSHFDYNGNFAHLYVSIDPSELKGTFSISATTGSGGTIDTSNLATKDELAQKQDIISDIDTIRTNAANYKGTVTGIKIDNVSKSPSSGVVNLGYINKQLATSTSSSMTLSPNIYYRNTNTSLSTLTISLGSISNSNILNEYLIEFTTRSSGTTVTLPSSVKWVNGTAPTLENGKTYQISIVNNLGTCAKFG